MSDPSKKLMHKEVIIKQYIGEHFDELGTVNGYDPATTKWWVINSRIRSGPLWVSAWFSEDEMEIIE